MTDENQTTTNAAGEGAPSGGGEGRQGGGGRDGDRRGGREGGGGGRGGRYRYQSRRKVCQFTIDKLEYIDYKDVDRLRKYISDRGKIEARRKTGTRAPYQRMLGTAIKRARFMALLPYTSEHVRVSGIGALRR
jgi:small subunit ribosomal protein S18